MAHARRILVGTLLAIAAHGSPTAEAGTSGRDLDARELSFACNVYVDAATDLHPSSETTYGVECALRLLVASDGQPYPGLGPGAFRLNHFASQHCGSAFDQPADVWDLGYGVYSVQLPCEPEDMSVVVAETGPNAKANDKARASAIVTWARDSYARGVLVGHSLGVQTGLEAVRAELESAPDVAATLQPALDSIQAAVDDNRSAIDSVQTTLAWIQAVTDNSNDILNFVVDGDIQGILNVVHAIKVVVDEIRSVVYDIESALP